ncbi:MAG: DUF1330 domain-containing protein [Streptosporangiaceae bacterium]
MTAYVVSRLRIRDPAAMTEYVAAAPPTVAAFGGRYLVRGNTVRALEGTWDHDRLVVVEFEASQDALGWYESAAYRPLRDLRRGAAESVILLAEGVDEVR